MSLLSGMAVYFIMWWVVLFTVLPWGATSAHERGLEIEDGHAPSAPLAHNIGRKFLVTTAIASVLFAGFYAVMTTGVVTLDDVPLLPTFRSS